MFEIAHYSSGGSRAKNEDAYATCITENGAYILCVADGVGGESNGEMASTFVVREFVEHVRQHWDESLAGLVGIINDKLIDHTSVAGVEQRVFTTFTGVKVTSNGFVEGTHVGDSRALVLRGNGIQQLTNDHTEAKRFVREGKLSKEELKTYPRKNVLDSAMGMGRIPEIQEFELQLFHQDRLILISDGIYGKVSKKEMRDISLTANTIRDLIERTIDAVEAAKPDDNFTIVGLEFKSS